MINYIIFWVLALFIILANALFDKNDDINKNIYVNHLEEGIFSGFIIAVICFACFSYDIINFHNWYPFIFNLSLYLPVRWIVFDLFLNDIRNKPLLYIGELKPTSSITDKFLHWVGKDFQIPMKLLLLIIVIVVNLLIIKKI